MLETAVDKIVVDGTAVDETDVVAIVKTKMDCLAVFAQISLDDRRLHRQHESSVGLIVAHFATDEGTLGARLHCTLVDPVAVPLLSCSVAYRGGARVYRVAEPLTGVGGLDQLSRR